MRDTWTLAVFGEMNSRAAIAQLVAPLATRQSTSRSRSVSNPIFCSGDPNDGRAAVAGRTSRTGSGGGANCTSSQPCPSSWTESQPRTTCSRAATRSRRSKAGASPVVWAPVPEEGSTRSAIRDSSPAMGSVARGSVFMSSRVKDRAA
jgi:hypothetical protein